MYAPAIGNGICLRHAGRLLASIKQVPVAMVDANTLCSDGILGCCTVQAPMCDVMQWEVVHLKSALLSQRSVLPRGSDPSMMPAWLPRPRRVRGLGSHVDITIVNNPRQHNFHGEQCMH